MRKKVLKALDDALLAELRPHWPASRRLDPKREEFNGILGFGLGCINGRYVFLTVTPHDSEDSFRCGVAWSTSDDYPRHPFVDLRAGIGAHLSRPDAEIQLADLSADVPHEICLDPQAAESRNKQAAIAARLAAGVEVTPEEWLDTLSTACPIQLAIDEARRSASEIVRALARVTSSEFHQER